MSLDVTLASGATTTRTVTVANTGLGPLQFAVSDLPAAAALADSASAGQPGMPLIFELLDESSLDANATSLTAVDLKHAGTPAAQILATNPVLIIQDQFPWGYDSIQQVLSLHGIAFDQVDSSQMATINLTPYSLVVIPSVQPNSFYLAWNANLSRL